MTNELQQQIRSYFPWANEDQAECIALLDAFERGIHHFDGKVRPVTEKAVSYTTTKSLATYDLSNLTRLVILAHKWCIRVEVQPASPNRLRLLLHRRFFRSGGEVWDRHPDLDDAIAAIEGVGP